MMSERFVGEAGCWAAPRKGPRKWRRRWAHAARQFMRIWRGEPKFPQPEPARARTASACAARHPASRNQLERQLSRLSSGRAPRQQPILLEHGGDLAAGNDRSPAVGCLAADADRAGGWGCSSPIMRFETTWIFPHPVWAERSPPPRAARLIEIEPVDRHHRLAGCGLPEHLAQLPHLDWRRCGHAPPSQTRAAPPRRPPLPAGTESATSHQPSMQNTSAHREQFLRHGPADGRWPVTAPTSFRNRSTTRDRKAQVFYFPTGDEVRHGSRENISLPKVLQRGRPKRGAPLRRNSRGTFAHLVVERVDQEKPARRRRSARRQFEIPRRETTARRTGSRTPPEPP